MSLYSLFPVSDGSATVGTVVARVIATDRDNSPFNRLSYELIGDARALVFFDVDSNGNIIVKRSLSTDSSGDYNIRVVVRDSGRPPKTATASATAVLTQNR